MKVLRKILNATPIGKVISAVVATVIVTTLFAMTPAMYLSSGSLAEIKTDPYIYVQNGTGSELLLDSDDNFYMVFVVDGDIYFRKYNYNHILAVPDTLLYSGGDNAHTDAALDGFGYIHLCWSTTTFGGRSVMYMKLDSDGNVVVDAIKLSATSSYINQQSRIATNSLGQAYVIWSYYQGTDPDWPTAVDVLYAKIDSDGTIIFTQYYVAPPEWATGFNPNLLVDHDDNLHITYQRGDRIPEVGYDNTYLYYKKFASDGTTVLVGDTKFADTHFVYWVATIDMTLDSANRINLVYSHGIRMPADGGAVETWFMKIDLNGIVLVAPKLVSIDDGYHSTVSYLATDDYDNNYIFWSDGKDGSYEIYYAALDTDGAPIVSQTRLTNTPEFSSTYYMAAVFDSGHNCYWSYWQVDDGTYVIYPVNQTPIADAGSDQIVNEGDTVQLNASASYDPDGSIETYEWDFDANDGLWWETSAVSDATGPTATHVYGDDGVYIVTLRVTDNDNLSATDTCNVTVQNVDPTVTIESITMDVEIGLRVAGRKYNDVGMTLYENGTPIGYVSIERMPGSPDEQMAWIPVSINFSKSYSATVTYTPEDPPNIGGNPVWIYIKSQNGSIKKIHHTFNVQQSKKRDSEHWNHVEPWEVDLNVHFIGLPFEITSHITDPGSDDETLTFTYGSQVKTVTYLTNPPNPDPYPSPEVNPVDIMDTTTLIYEGPGKVTLVVKDDDNIRLGVGEGTDSKSAG